MAKRWASNCLPNSQTTIPLPKVSASIASIGQYSRKAHQAYWLWRAFILRFFISCILCFALNRAPILAHDGQPDFVALAAAYGVGLAKNHPFLDGNKRTAFVSVELFLVLNGYALHASDADCVMTMLAVAAGEMDEHACADWIRQHNRQRD